MATRKHVPPIELRVDLNNAYRQSPLTVAAIDNILSARWAKYKASFDCVIVNSLSVNEWREAVGLKPIHSVRPK